MNRFVRAFAALAALAGLSACQPQIPSQDFSFGTEYQAVVLVNGQVFYGRIEQLDRPFPVLRDAYYLASQTDAEGHTRAVLLKRGREPHGPGFMHISARHIAVIEPVAPDSKIAQLIAESKRQPAPGDAAIAPPAAPGAARPQP